MADLLLSTREYFTNLRCKRRKVLEYFSIAPKRRLEDAGASTTIEGRGLFIVLLATIPFLMSNYDTILHIKFIILLSLRITSFFDLSLLSI